MILTATTNNDGSVKLQADISANYDVYRSANGSTFVKIGSVLNGITYIDQRPNMNWQLLPGANSITFTGRKIGVLAEKFGYGSNGKRWQLVASVYEDGTFVEDIDLSTAMNTVGWTWDYMTVWAKEYPSIVTKTISLSQKSNLLGMGGLNVNGFWVETGEQVIEFGQQGWYKFKNTSTGGETTVSVTPKLKVRERLSEIGERILAYQLSQPNQTIDPGPTPYRMWRTLPFAYLYYVTKDQRYKDAAIRQFNFAKQLRDAQNRIPYGSIYKPDYNSRHAFSAYVCYKVFGDKMFLDEADVTAQGMITNWGGQSAWGYSPVCLTDDTQDWFASIGGTFSMLYSEPNSAYYHNSNFLTYAKKHLGAWSTFLDPTTNEVNMGQLSTYVGNDKHPDGTYSGYSSYAWIGNRLLRNADGSAMVPELDSKLNATQNPSTWELKYNVEPMLAYCERYQISSGDAGTVSERIVHAYSETQKGNYSLEKWSDFFQRTCLSPAVNANYTYPNSSTSGGYYPPGTDIVSEQWFANDQINVAFGPSMAIVAGLPEEWIIPEATLAVEQPPATTIEPAYFNSQLDTVTFDRVISDYFPSIYSRSYFPVTFTVDTIRKLTNSISGLIDTKRKLTNDNTLTADTKRKITNTNTLNPDTKRIVRVSNLLQVDTRRLVSALVSTASDTLRQIMGTNVVTSTVDALRRVIVSDTNNSDAKRNIHNTNIVNSDTKRSLRLNVQNAIDIARKLTNDVTNVSNTMRQILNLDVTVLQIDTLRKIVNSQFVRFDSKRSVWKQVQTWADTIRKFFTGGAWPVIVETDIIPRQIILDETQRKVLMEVDGQLANIVVTAGNTVNLKATFFDADGNPADPAGSIKFVIFDEGQNELESININSANKISDGVYCYDYTTPRASNRFLYWEASSTLGEMIELNRKRIELKWVI